MIQRGTCLLTCSIAHLVRLTELDSARTLTSPDGERVVFGSIGSVNEADNKVHKILFGVDLPPGLWESVVKECNGTLAFEKMGEPSASTLKFNDWPRLHSLLFLAAHQYLSELVDAVCLVVV